MKRVRVQTPKKNDLKLLGRSRSVRSSHLLKSLSMERNLKKLEKRLSEQESRQTRHVQSVSIDAQINKLEADWEEIKQQRKENR